MTENKEIIKKSHSKSELNSNEIATRPAKRKNKKGRPPKLNKPTKIRIKKELSKKQQEHTDYFLNIGNYKTTYGERIDQMHRTLKISKTYLYRISKRLDWRGRLRNFLLNKEDKEEISELMKTKETFNTDISFSDLSNTLKENTILSLIIGNGLLKTSLRMLKHYSEKLEKLYIDTEKLKNINADQRALLEHCEKKINKYKEDLKFMINPAQIGIYLNMLGLEKELSGLNTDEKLTPDHLQKMLIELGGKSSQEKENDAEKMIFDINREKSDTMQLDGRLINDHNTQAINTNKPDTTQDKQQDESISNKAQDNKTDTKETNAQQPAQNTAQEGDNIDDLY